MKAKQTAALLIQCLEAQGVKFIFGIPGAKIDAVFDALESSSIQLVLCRHEQNAAFMAGAYGRLTGEPGVVLVTSGPGVSNLATGLLTATTEGDPIVAIGGSVPRAMAAKASHQSADNIGLMKPVTKSCVEITMPQMIPEVVANAFRLAKAPCAGACFISLPQDVANESVVAEVIPALPPISYGQAQSEFINQAAYLINQAQQPVLLLGQEASRPQNATAIRQFLEKTHLPTVMTFQAAGSLSQSLLDCFAGRVGLFRNQPGDSLLSDADLIMTVGFNTVEYDPEVWNRQKKPILHCHYHEAPIHQTYQPVCELLGDIDANLISLASQLNPAEPSKSLPYVRALKSTCQGRKTSSDSKRVHPLDFIRTLRQLLDNKTLISCDVGSVYMWMARYFLAFEPHQLLFSNGQQTLGVALPWAMAGSLIHPKQKGVSISGDGGFLFSAMELETAVRMGCNVTHFVWRDGSYDMVKEQELMKYRRRSGVDFGKVDLVSFAKAFGARGYCLAQANDLPAVMEEALSEPGMVLVDVPIDYSDNHFLFEG